jgi:hypothetical protein
VADPLTDAEAADLRGENARLRQAYMTYKEAALRLEALRSQSDACLEESLKAVGDLRSCFEQTVLAYRRGAHPDNLRQLYQAIDQNLLVLRARIQQAQNRDQVVTVSDTVRPVPATRDKTPKAP